jgi:hypothetical protein
MAEVSDRSKTTLNCHRINVTVEPQQLSRFNGVIHREADAQPDASLSVPLTFPANWYGLSEVQAQIAQSVGIDQQATNFVLLHLEQSIERIEELEVGQDYTLDLEIGAVGNDGKLLVKAVVSNLQTDPMAYLTSLFYVVDTQGKSQ